MLGFSPDTALAKGIGVNTQRIEQEFSTIYWRLASHLRSIASGLDCKKVEGSGQDVPDKTRITETARIENTNDLRENCSRQ
jgi:hypothetical protein